MAETETGDKINLTTGAEPPNYDATEKGGSDLPPPAYNSLYGQLVEAKDQSDNNAAFARNACAICCASVITVILTLIGSGIAVACIVIGALYLDDCPAQRMIPIYLIVMGSTYILKSMFTTARYCCNRDKGKDEEESKAWQIERILDCFIFAWFIVGNVYIYRTYWVYQSADPTLNNFCDKTLYVFSFWVITATYILIGLNILLACCCCCFFCCCAGKARSQQPE